MVMFFWIANFSKHQFISVVLGCQTVYEHFNAYRAALVRIESKLSSGDEVFINELDALEAVATGKEGKPGLASFLKNDLGSYRDIAIGIPQSRPTKIYSQSSVQNSEDVPAAG